MTQNKERIKVLLTLDVDIETGETVCVGREVINDDLKKEKKTTTTKKPKKEKDENPNPCITLEDNKYILNAAAVELLGVEPEDRLDIKYEKQGKGVMIPVIGTNEAFGTKGGNKLTKGFSVSCRGKANEELSQYGSVFTIIPHPNKDDLFILCGDKKPNPVPEVIDENVVVDDDEPSSEESLPMDLNIDELVEDSDKEIKEISSFDFDLND